MAFTIAGEAESTISWPVLRTSGEVIKEGSFTADDSVENVEFNVAEGDYELEVTSVDDNGNESASTLSIAVAAEPRTPAEIAKRIAVLMTVVLILVLAIWLVWRNRARIAAWHAKRRLDAARRAIVRRHAAEVRAHQESVSQYQAALAAHQRADSNWKERREFLVGLEELAQSATGATPVYVAEVTLRKGVRVYTSVSGVLIDTRTQQGVSQLTPVEHGRVTVTSPAIVFMGSKKREWIYDKIDWSEHIGELQTIMKAPTGRSPRVCNTPTPSEPASSLT